MLELNRTHNMDCLEGMKLLEDNSIDLIVTSPPYNKKGLRKGKNTGGKRWSNCGGNINYSVYDDNIPEDKYREWQIKILNECYRILKPSGSMFYNHKVRRYNNQGYYPDFIFSSNLKFYQQIIWNRKSFADGNIGYLNPTTELIFWMTKDKPSVYKKQASIKGEIWEITPRPNKLHPAPFPEDIPENCILLTTKEGDIVLDIFSGSGTTLLSANKLHRNYIGFEIDEGYCNVSNNLINNSN